MTFNAADCDCVDGDFIYCKHDLDKLNLQIDRMRNALERILNWQIRVQQPGGEYDIYTIAREGLEVPISVPEEKPFTREHFDALRAIEPKAPEDQQTEKRKCPICSELQLDWGDARTCPRCSVKPL